MYFRDRTDAGQQLARKLADLQGQTDLLVLGIPRGGVIVACEVARALNAELDLCLTHKLGAPGNPELAIGAIAEDGTTVLDDTLINCLGATATYIKMEVERQRAELARRAKTYRGDQPAAEISGRTVIIVDDGIATGATMVASLQALAPHKPTMLIAAVPVAPKDAVERLRAVAGRVECLLAPGIFWAVGSFYDHFGQVSDEEVIALLHQSSG